MSTIKTLVIGGGGGGGNPNGGGGGAGGYLYDAAFTIAAGSYSVTVGDGGAAATNGSNSVLSSITAIGGGKGGNQSAGGSNGGSGGGAAGDNDATPSGLSGGTGSQGNNGGSGDGGTYYGGGGGGGSASVGGNGTYLYGGAGGTGTLNPITGSGYLAAGGGAYGQNPSNGGSSIGGNGSANGTGGNGTANTGSGGGGGAGGGAGGKGLVQIAYKTDGSDGLGILSTGGTITTSGSYTVHTFTSSGTLVLAAVTPSLTTEAVSSIDITTATGNGTVTSDGGYIITERGICWKTSTGPTTSDSKVVVSGTTGAFTGAITGLSAGTLYYVRSYATNALGTSYGNEVTFTSLSLSSLDLVKDISGIEGATYAVSVDTVVTTGSLTLKLGTTGDSVVITTTATHVLQGLYGGLSGIIITQSADFTGTIDNVMWVLVVGTASINWTLDVLSNSYLIDSSVKFRRVEDKEVSRFNMYRYLDVVFKDLDGYVTTTITDERNDASTTKSKVYIVGNTTGDVSPFVKKRISILSKNQAILVSFSNAKLNETFTLCQYSLTGFKEPRKQYQPSKIISI